MDISKLDDSQIRIANKVMDEAVRQGVNPDYALSIAYAENQFGSKPSKKGALGPMQLIPSTAKMMGVNDPNNEDQNIAGGVKYIKYLTQQPNIGNDPMRVAIGYNAGHNHKFFTSNDIKDLPDETVDYTNNIMDFHNGHVPNVLGQTSVSQPDAAGNNEIFGDQLYPGADNAAEAKKAKEAAERKAKNVTAGTGVAVGLGVGSAAEGVYGGVKALDKITSAGAPVTLENIKNTIKGNNPVVNWENATSGGNSPLSQIEKEQQSGYGESHAARQDATKKMETVQSKDFGKGAQFTEESPNILQMKSKTIPGQEIPKVPVQESEGLGTAFLKKGLVRLPISAFGGAMAFLDANNAYHEGWTPHGVLSGMSALGGGFQMIPTVPTELAGAALQAPLALYDLADYGTQKISPLNRQQINESIDNGSVYP